MEFIPRGNLMHFLQDERNVVPWPLKYRIATNITDAIAFLHAQNPKIIHRDLKSPNILVNEKSTTSFFCPLVIDHRSKRQMMSDNDDMEVVCKVSDFGESLAVATKAQGRENLANPAWCAPEIMKGEPYTEKADVFSIGILMNELVSRLRPYAEYPVSKSRFVAQFEDAIIGGLRPTIPTDTPAEWAAIVKQCWSADPEARPTALDIVAQLRPLSTKFGVIRTPGIPRLATEPPPSKTAAPAKTPTKVSVPAQTVAPSPSPKFASGPPSGPAFPTTTATAATATTPTTAAPVQEKGPVFVMKKPSVAASQAPAPAPRLTPRTNRSTLHNITLPPLDGTGAAPGTAPGSAPTTPTSTATAPAVPQFPAPAQSPATTTPPPRAQSTPPSPATAPASAAPTQPTTNPRTVRSLPQRPLTQNFSKGPPPLPPTSLAAPPPPPSATEAPAPFVPPPSTAFTVAEPVPPTLEFFSPPTARKAAALDPSDRERLLKDKLQSLLLWAHKVIEQEMKPKLGQLINQIQKSASLSESVRIAQSFSASKTVKTKKTSFSLFHSPPFLTIRLQSFMKAKELCGEAGFPVVGKGKVDAPPTADKAEQVRVTVFNALLEMTEIVLNLQKAIATGPQTSAVGLIQILKALKNDLLATP
jgi:serine/threonine protein kinase